MLWECEEKAQICPSQEGGGGLVFKALKAVKNFPQMERRKGILGRGNRKNKVWRHDTCRHRNIFEG